MAAGAGPEGPSSEAAQATEPLDGGHRRIDRVLAAGFAADLAGLDLAALRARREDADQEETDLSYLRRLLQARLDLVTAEQDRRASGGAPPTDVVDYLAHVLAGEERGAPHGSGRFSTREPSRAGESRRYVEQLVSDQLLTSLLETPDAELTAARTSLVEAEHAVSEQRHAVQGVLDALTAEVGRRYRDGEASVDSLLAES